MQSSEKADHVLGKLFGFFVVVVFPATEFISSQANQMKFMDQPAVKKIKEKERLQRQTAHLIAQLSVEVMCKILFR